MKAIVDDRVLLLDYTAKSRGPVMSLDSRPARPDLNKLLRAT